MVNTRNSKRKSPPARANNDANLADAKRSLRDISDDEAVGSDHPLILVPSRENDFNMKTWWMVDLVPVEESSLQGASALVKRCMRIHGWDERRRERYSHHIVNSLCSRRISRIGMLKSCLRATWLTKCGTVIFWTW
mmetsp:Transcript_3265/g.5447  ORF Transcript_3265/g.5447 Transcript_3265/m.5447 type:complete len:136 (+) Transcript_3265:58-465(+)